MPRTVYRFDTFQLDVSARELVSQEERIVLPSSAFACLAYLVEHRDRAVDRDELISAIWGRPDVTDTQLGQVIVRVRSALGDTGRVQRFVRTVPRFGYRFVADVAVDMDMVESSPGAAAAMPEGAVPASAPLDSMRTDAASVDATPVTDTLMAKAAPMPGSGAASPDRAASLFSPRWLLASVGFGLAGLALAIVLALRTSVVDRASPEAVPTDAPIAVSETPAPAVPVIVWPASVTAEDDWAWLRLGIMDLVSNRLRAGKLPTMPSDNVVGIVRAKADGLMPVSGVPLVPADSLRIEPAVERDGRRWIVSLRARGGAHDLIAVATSDDVLSAARNATDSLLIKLGHAPPVIEEFQGHAVEELVQRANAASLSGQIQRAANLIEQAPAALQAAPEVGYILANVEMRAGRYADSEKRIEALLARETGNANPVMRGRLLNSLAAIRIRRDQIEAAHAAYGEAAKVLAGRDGRALGLANLGLGITAAAQGDISAATVHLGQARIEMEGAGNLLGVAQIDGNLASIDIMRHRPADALRRLLDVETRFAQLAAQEETTFARIAIADAHLQLLEPDQARLVIDRSWPVEEHVANERMRWEVVAMRAQVLAAQGHLGEADALLANLQQASDPVEDAGVRALGLSVSARIAAWRGLDEQAAQLALAAATPALERYSSDRRAYVLNGIVRLRSLRRLGEGAKALAESAAWSTQAGGSDADDWRLAWTDLAQAEQAWGEGRRAEAMPLFDSAFRRIQHFAIPEDLVAIAQPYILALIDQGDVARAATIAGTIATWADRDFRVAWAQTRLYRAIDKPSAARQAMERALQLAGERALPGERRTAIPPTSPR